MAEEKQMTVDELYEYVTSKMSPEHALKQLLHVQVENYTQMKLGKPVESGSINPLMIVMASASEMGWDICIEKDNPDELVRGVVIGTEEYIDKIFPE
jgi:hypothetical protein